MTCPLCRNAAAIFPCATCGYGSGVTDDPDENRFLKADANDQRQQDVREREDREDDRRSPMTDDAPLFDYSLEDLNELREVDPTFALFAQFVREWQADPYLDPSVADYLRKCQEEYGELEMRRLAGMIEVYIHVAPEPKYTDEQREELRKKFNELIVRFDGMPSPFSMPEDMPRIDK